MQPILHVNLTTGEMHPFDIPHDGRETFLGGASLAARLLYEHLIPSLDPLSPQAPLLFMTGPLTGTAGPLVGRYVVCARSPATGLWGESNCGGFWGPELRKAGFDGLWVEGRASEPMYLWIRDGKCEIRPAQRLWGKDTYETRDALQAQLGGGMVRVASIGLAGENQIPFASILCDHGRAAGRSGMGAVMGAKNLKAIAVYGSGEIPLAEPQTYARLRSEANRSLKGDNKAQVLRDLGTSGAAEYFSYVNEMPIRYFSLGTFPDELHTSGAYLKETILAGNSACHACVVACGRVVRLEDGEKRKGPEYETLVGFGPNLMLNDPMLATRWGEICDRYGMDTISMSNTLGLAFRLFEMGRITPADMGGLALHFGEAEAVEPLLHQTARRQGFGAYLAQGALQMARHFNAEEEAVQVKGLEVPYHDPRGFSGMALVYATSPRGACHNQSDYHFIDMGETDPQLGIEYYDRLTGGEKATNVVIHQNWHTLFNALVMCLFANLEADKVVGLINAACGLDWTLPEALEAGERSWNLKRVINQRLGLKRENDRLPKALLKPQADSPEGESGYVPPFDEMLQTYYTARGWDPVTGCPTPAKLRQLGLDWVAQG